MRRLNKATDYYNYNNISPIIAPNESIPFLVEIPKRHPVGVTPRFLGCVRSLRSLAVRPPGGAGVAGTP